MRIRIIYEKTKSLRYTSSLDMQLFWERLFRRAQLPIAYSQGFHPQARIQQALPLPLGFTSSCETVDVWLEFESSVESIIAKLTTTRMTGILIKKVDIVAEFSPSLQKKIISCQYLVSSIADINLENLESRILEFLSQVSIPRIRNSKPYDLRPLVTSISIDKKQPGILNMNLVAQEGATARPEEVISALGLNPFEFNYHRYSYSMQSTI
jgi:radical SAM-linked protein